MQWRDCFNYEDHRLVSFNLRVPTANVLRQYDISFYAVNTSTSLMTNTKTLYVGIRDPSLMPTYDQHTRTLFSTHH
ncbi:unnamed protein product [Rotaria magnacalcarata]|uniref:Uncharacterized protein n=1 Tax=Rotaria magnacalcarata TaxID=392030 RepID=A0A819IJB9_9BILA|nr:unnamed protein product [Rotaria magnacalcarata]CAF3967077.1 unnamed protein product [Rotaria magnacalcarata]CAF3992652.1 unnamed protein product [Rotaria magnacalcarata]CAF4048157.1 unnamed protein product [Rotaria magnacalcarata]